MKSFWFRLLLPVWCLALCLPAGEIIYRDGDISRITAMASRVMFYNHFSGCRDKELLSRRTFEYYFRFLDPQRFFFTAGDIEEFAKERDRIFPDMLQGQFGFANRVHRLHLQRMREYSGYINRMTAGPVDFTADEYWESDRKELPWPADEAAMHDLWRRYIKHRLLSYKLNDLADDIDPAAASAEAKERRQEEKKSASKRKPEERLQAYARDQLNSVAQKNGLDVAGELLDAMCYAFGAHSNYSTPAGADDFNIHMSLQLSGIGATLSCDGGYIKVVELIPGGPAEKCGKIKVNDRILGVTQQDGTFTDLVDMNVSKAVTFIRGPENSKVTLDMQSEVGVNYRVKLVRKVIDLKSSAASGKVVKAAPGGGRPVTVGVLRLPSFYLDIKNNKRAASRDIWKILLDFRKQGVQAIVLDLRNNGGGSFPDCLNIASLFLDSGRPEVQVGTCSDDVRTYSAQSVFFDDRTDYNGAFKEPMVILLNKLSASASEVLTGALRDNRRAIVVGDTRSFGKGTILTVNDLDDANRLFAPEQPGGSVTYEIAMFFRPSGPSVQEAGVAADIVLPSLTEDMEAGEKFLPNHLPCQKVNPVAIPQLNVRDPVTLLPVLRRNSAARIAASKEYQSMIKLAEFLKEERQRKKTSLNLARRSEETKRTRGYLKQVEEFTESKDKMSPDLREAVNIAAELYRMQ